ncbi:NAD(P)-dependent oxidoreductase, partial [Acinetobacter schindleri]
NAVQLAATLSLDIPVASQALSQLKAHQQDGFAEADLATVIKHVDH